MSRRPRRLTWGATDEPSSKRPMRDSLLVYGGLALVVVAFAWLSGGSLVKALVVAIVFFVLASGWALLRLRRRTGAED